MAADVPSWRRLVASMDLRDRRVVALATVALALLASLHALLLPSMRGPDETQHQDMVLEVFEDHTWSPPDQAWVDPAIQVSRRLTRWHLRADRRQVEEAQPRGDRPTWHQLELEVADVDEEGGVHNHIAQHPPLYYVVVAGPWGLLQSTGLGLAHDQALMGLRLVTMLLALPIPLLVWLLARRLGAARREGRAAVILALAIPQVVALAGNVQNDALLNLLGGAFLFTLAGVLRGRRDLGTALSLGVVTGLGLLTKGFALVWLPLVVVAWLWGGRRRLRSTIRPLAASLGVALPIGGWWWVRNVVRDGRLQPTPLFADRVAPGPPADLVSWLTGFARRFVDGFWGAFGTLDASFPRWLTIVAWLVLLVLVVVGLVAWNRRPSADRAGLVDLVILATPAAGMAVVLVGTSLSRYLEDGIVAGMQGRYLFQGLGVVLMIGAVGLRGLVGRREVAVAVTAAALLEGAGVVVALENWYGPRSGEWSLGAALRAWGTWLPWAPATVAIAWCGLAVVATVGVLKWSRDDRIPRPDDNHGRRDHEEPVIGG